MRGRNITFMCVIYNWVIYNYAKKFVKFSKNSGNDISIIMQTIQT